MTDGLFGHIFSTSEENFKIFFILLYESEKWKWSRSVVSDSSRPHGLQPTRLLRPWDFPGKSTGVGAVSLDDCKTAACTNVTSDGMTPRLPAAIFTAGTPTGRCLLTCCAVKVSLTCAFKHLGSEQGLTMPFTFQSSLLKSALLMYSPKENSRVSIQEASWGLSFCFCFLL